MTSKLNYRNAAGALLFVGGLQAFMIVIAAETLFPGYNTRNYDLSDLASTVPPNTSPVQLSAAMFNTTVFLLGLIVFISAYLIHRAYGKRLFTALFAIFGAAGMAVGIFPGDTGVLHGLVALVWFVSGPLSAIAAYRLETKPLAYFSVAIGVFALLDLVSSLTLGELSPFMAFGRGGEERMAAYPLLVWVVGFGGYLMGASQTKEG